MIRINLLPREEKASRKAPISFKAGELLIPVAVVVAAVLVMMGTAFSQSAHIRSLRTSIEKIDEESRRLAPQIERVNRLAQERAELDLRLGIIGKLEKGRTASVRTMDELAKCVPDHLWLTSADQSGGMLTVGGVTMSNLVVSEFMSRLERSPMFAQVELNLAERGKVANHDLVKFELKCQVTPDEPAN
jgi:type IV pilus assembly protein PilN